MLKGQGDISGLKRLADKARASASADRYFVAADTAAFGPCVTNPEKIICIGLNYRKHIAEMNAQVPKMPVLFSKYNTALNNHGGTVGVSETDGVQFDYEAELVIVIGRTARNVTEADAASYIFGITAGNDVSERNWQRDDLQWFRAKASDTFGPLGPFIVPKEFVKDPTNVRHTFTLNGQVMQDSNTSRMSHNVYELLHYASNILTLNSGDVISGGSPAGTNIERAEPRWMRAGDTAVCTIEGIGTQTHAVVADTDAQSR